jgi:hypothetical protein
VVFYLLVAAAAHGSGVPLAAEGDFLSSLGGVPVAGETEDSSSMGIDVGIVNDVEGISFPESGKKQGVAVNLMAAQAGDGWTGSVSPGEVAPVDAVVTLPAEAPHSGRLEREGGRQARLNGPRVLVMALGALQRIVGVGETFLLDSPGCR